MKEFASVIARGNFDEPLLMEKNNIFGIFTESFDVMREELKASKNREIALKMKEKELKMRGSHLAYGFLQLPIVDGTNRYAFFKDERYLSPIDNPTVTVIYMEGPAPLEYLKQKFGQQ